jgi:hypothetical protein
MEWEDVGHGDAVECCRRSHWRMLGKIGSRVHCAEWPVTSDGSHCHYFCSMVWDLETYLDVALRGQVIVSSGTMSLNRQPEN